MGGIRLGGVTVLAPQFVPVQVQFFSGFTQHYIGVVSLDPGQDLTAITTPPVAEDEDNPVLSPDGTQVAFVWTTSGPSSRIYVCDIDGSNLTIVYDQADPGDVGSVECVSWHPDGTSLIFTSSWGAPESLSLYTCPVTASATITTLYTGAANLGNVQYNFDGSRIAFTKFLGSTSLGLWTANADGTGDAQLDTLPTQFSQTFFEKPPFSWFNSSNRLVWNDGTLAAPVWKAMNDDGTSVTTVLTPGYAAGHPSRLQIDPTDDHIFYKVSAATSIRKAQLDGSGNSLLITTSALVTSTNLFVFHDQRLYWDAGDDVWSCLLDGTDERNEGSGTLHNLGLGS